MDTTFELYKGRTYTRDFTISEYDEPIDEVLFTVCESTENRNYCLRKSLNNGITVVETGEDEEGIPFTTFNILLNATDTDKMKTGEYGYDIVLYSGDKKIEAIMGAFKLNGTYTKTCNE